MEIAKDGIDSVKEFNDRLDGNEKKSDDINLHQQIVDLETRLLIMKGDVGRIDCQIAERFKRIEDVIDLYRENVRILDGIIESYKQKKFKLVEVECQ